MVIGPTWIAIVQWFGKADYAALPGAMDAHGEHRCVFCGNKGIWKRTPYATNSTVAACSKCEETLYIE